jgi:hypothetical protein
MQRFILATVCKGIGIQTRVRVPSAGAECGCRTPLRVRVPSAGAGRLSNGTALTQSFQNHPEHVRPSVVPALTQSFQNYSEHVRPSVVPAKGALAWLSSSGHKPQSLEVLITKDETNETRPTRASYRRLLFDHRNYNQ